MPESKETIPTEERPKLIDLVRDVLDEYKANDVNFMNVAEKTVEADLFVICSATSKVHAKSLAEEVHFRAKHAGFKPIGEEIQKADGWKIIDFGSIVVHIFLESERKYYDLEKLWSGAPRIEAIGE